MLWTVEMRYNVSQSSEENGGDIMKFTYPAVIHKTEEGIYRATFPDLICCEAKGDSLDEVVENANAAAYDWLETELSEEDYDLPPVTDFRDIALQEGDLVRNICVNIKFYVGWDE